MNTTKKSGFTIIEVVIVLVVIGIIVGLGYAFFTNKNKQMADTNQQNTSEQQGTPAPAEEVSSIESSDDLDKAINELDQLEIDNTSDDKSLESSMSEM